jgi:pantoate--beta-alanine ligase
MDIITDPHAMRAWSRAQRLAGHTVGLVPTMGALHQGHVSLMEAAARENGAAIASIFVNPAQFAPHEDYDAYPRTWESDLEASERAGIRAIYAPRDKDLYPTGYATYITVEALDKVLCSRSRPHFFRGVATVVAKLFNACDPDRAYFGEKDGQQLAVIRRMTRDLDFGIEIVGMPTVREPDGLAMSSRNRYLTTEQRERALCLSRALEKGRRLMEAGERRAATIIEAVREEMAQVDLIDYIELVDALEMTPVEEVAGEVMLAVAARVGEARLIDNIRHRVNPAPVEHTAR